jgi:hypothetical protein
MMILPEPVSACAVAAAGPKLAESIAARLAWSGSAVCRSAAMLACWALKDEFCPQAGLWVA